MRGYIYIDKSYWSKKLSETQRDVLKTITKSILLQNDSEQEHYITAGIDVKYVIILIGIKKDFYKEALSNRENLSGYANQIVDFVEPIIKTYPSVIDFDGEIYNDIRKEFEKLINSEKNVGGEIGETKLECTDNKLLNSFILCGDNVLSDITVEGCYISKTSMPNLCTKYGIGVIRTSDSIADVSPYGSMLIKEEKYQWKNIILSLPANSLIIADQFAFKDENVINSNILKIINLLIAKSTIIHISIFTNKSKCIDNSIEKLHTKLKDLIGSEKVNIEIIHSADEFHDRFIITNNMYITIGGGFDVLTQDNNKSKKNTTVLSFAFSPITSQKWLLDAYYQYIIGMKKKKSAVEHSTNNIYNKIDNRLLL